MCRHAILALCWLAIFATASAAGPAARLSDLAWLEGTWVGEGVAGAPALEVWSPAAGNAMPGHFRQLKPDGSVMFYELATLVEREGSLVYRVKHFNADLSGRESQAEVREFPLTAVGSDSWTFADLTYRRDGPDRLTATVVTADEKGGRSVLTFRYRRKAG